MQTFCKLNDLDSFQEKAFLLALYKPSTYSVLFILRTSWHGKKFISSNAKKIAIGNVYLSIFGKAFGILKIMFACEI